MDTKSDIKKHVTEAKDRGESPSLMEPMRIGETSRHRAALSDLALELAARSAGFRSSVPGGMRTSLADLVRSMNCYYSNLIEGHDTHPVDIERALNNDYSDDRRKRDLQLEARAHIAVQKWIDSGGLSGRTVTADGIADIHRRFCAELPESLLWAEDPKTGKHHKVIPGALRKHDVKVGDHIPVSPGSLHRFMAHFEQAYVHLGKTDAIVAAAAAHHRFLWIHPYLDGNGRVARLMSHAMLLESLNTGGVWSIARGLARNVDKYKSLLANCDMPRRNSLDGQGNLSEEALADFTRFFLETCLDQIAFMEELVQPERLRVRIQMWVEEEIRLGNLPPKSDNVLEAILYRGELARADAAEVVGSGDRHARRIVSALIASGVLASESTRAPLRLVFPARLASRWMPGLFPDRAG